MLEILWLKDDPKGYTDLIPLKWLAQEGESPDLTHEILGPKRGRHLAKCSLSVDGRVVVFNYGGIHRQQNEDVLGVTPGETEVEFSDQTRQSIVAVRWRREGQADFRAAPVAASLVEDYDLEDVAALGVEGTAKLVSHFRLERDPTLRQEKLKLLHGQVLRCEACSFDFEAVYGPLGRSVCEVHHKVPLAATGPRKTSLTDLAILCANCHRAIHRTQLMADVTEFSKRHIRKVLDI